MRRILLFALALLVVTSASSSTADAQVRLRWFRSPFYYAGVPYPYGRYGYRFTSNPIEGARYGMAEVIRARGQAYEARARGMINYEEARSKYLDNRKKWTETYWELKRMGEAERRKEFEETRARQEAYLAAKGSSYPPRLSPSELDPTTGKIYWPEPLTADIYAELREELEELFVLRAYTGSSRRYGAEIHEKARAMQGLLKEQIRSMPTGEYIAARNFLESLAFEGRYPATG